VYALKNAKDVSALKAVSQNLMHENLTITDGVYGILSETDVRKQIADLSYDVAKNNDLQELRILINRLLNALETGNRR
jgi:hypothetical protein